MSALATVRPRFSAAAWPQDPATLELRWAALTISVMAGLAGAAHALAGPASSFGTAFVVSALAAVILGAIVLAARQDGVVLSALRSRPARLALAPLVVCVGLAAAGPPPADSLTPPAATPLLSLALSYAAVGPGFGLAAGLVGAMTVAAMAAHATEPGHGLVDAETVGLAVRSLVSILAAAGLHLVIGRLRRERRRADALAERQQARVGELERLHRILARFDGSAPLASVLASVVADLGREFGLGHASLYLVEPDGSLVMAGAIDYAAPIPRFPLGSGVMGRAARTRRTQWVRDVTADPDYVSADAAVTSELAVPLVHADEVLGVLNIEGTRERPISAAHVAVTEMIGGAIASAVRLARLGEAREREVDRLVALHAILRRFDGSRSIREVMGDVARDVAERFGIPLVALYLPSGDGRLELVGVAGYDGPIGWADPAVGVIGRAATLRRTEFVPDVERDPDYRAARADIRSEVAVPIVHDDELLGVVNFEGTDADPIGPGDVAIAELVAGSIAAAIRSAQLDEERRERLDSIERVLAVSRDLAADLDRERVIVSICGAARDLLHADLVAYLDRAPDGGYRVEHGVGLVDAAVVGTPVDVADGLLGQALARRQRVVGRVGPDDWPTLLGALAGQARLGIALPLEIDGSVAGLLVASRVDERDRLADVELRIADLLVAQAIIALRNADLHGRVAEAAVRDPLTGLLNRRYFDTALIHAFAAARRAGTPLSVIVLDLDRFSAVNNEHGHAVGDEVLRRVADVLRVHVREADIAARYGGEEFVVIAPGATRDQAVEVAERIRTTVARSSRTPIDGIHVPIALSAGVASMLGDERDAEELFRAADSGLLAAKRAGRDRVVAV
jgi:diguanylate cyclase (GGDEF)-like protein